MSSRQNVTQVREYTDTDENVAAEHHAVARDGGVPTAVLASRVVWFVAGFIITLLVLRMVLLLLAANQGNAFVDFVYALSAIFAAPFFGIFAYTPAYGSSVFEISSLVAILVYALVAWGLVRLLTLGSRHADAV